MLRRRALFPLVLASLLLPVAAHAGAAPQGSQAKAKAKRSCIVHRYNASGRKVVFRVSVYRYKYVRRNGARVRTIVRRKVALRGSCRKARACVKVKVTTAGRLTIVTARRRVRVRVKRGSKLVMRRLTRKVPVLGRCVKPDISTVRLGVPVKITVIPPSKAVLDFGVFKGEMPIAGSITGYSPQAKINRREDVPIVLTSATLTLGSTPIYVDGACAGRQTASLRTGRSGSARLDGSRDSTALLTPAGGASGAVFLSVRLPLELRDGEAGCDKPYIDTQYAEWPLRLGLAGRADPKAGLADVRLASSPAVADDLALCMNPGLQTEPCAGFQIPLPIPVSTELHVRIDLNAK